MAIDQALDYKRQPNIHGFENNLKQYVLGCCYCSYIATYSLHNVELDLRRFYTFIDFMLSDDHPCSSLPYFFVRHMLVKLLPIFPGALHTQPWISAISKYRQPVILTVHTTSDPAISGE